MNYFKNVYYCLRNDLTCNRWLRGAKTSPLKGHILMFHHVTDEHLEINASCQCKVEEFKRILSNYKKADYEFVSIAKALDYCKENAERKFVVVTFDDIPDNVYTNAYPILKELQIPFTVFIAHKMINRRSGDLTMEHLLALSKEELCTIGAHTMTHPKLRYAENSEWEIRQSKVELEQMIGKPVKVFAYPFGRYSTVSDKNIKEVKASGFDCAFSSIPASLNRESFKDLYFLPRIVPEVNKINEFQTEWTVIGAIFELLKQPAKWVLRRK